MDGTAELIKLYPQNEIQGRRLPELPIQSCYLYWQRNFTTFTGMSALVID